MALSKWSTWSLTLAGAALGAVAVGWLCKRSSVSAQAQPSASDVPLVHLPLAASRQPPADVELFAAHLLEWPAPDSVVRAAGPASDRVTARPRQDEAYRAIADDYDSLDPEDLGAAFLAGATDTALEAPPKSTADLSGFQIFEPSDGERS